MSTQPNDKDQQQHQNLWITHVNAVGPYLKVCGQLNPIVDLPERLKKEVLPSCQVIHNSWPNMKKKQLLSIGQMYLVRSVNRVTTSGDHELLRARLLRIVEMQPQTNTTLVEVDFVDMGYTKILECEELLIAPQDNNLMGLPALGSQYIMLDIFADWRPDQLEDILKLIARQSFKINVEMEIEGHKFIKMNFKGWDFTEFLVTQRKMGSPICTDYQRQNFLRVLKGHEEKDFKNVVNINNNNSYKQNYNIEAQTKTFNNNGSITKAPRPLLGQNIKSPLEEATAIKHQYQQQQIQQQQRLIQQQQQIIQQHQQINYGVSPNILLPNIPRIPRNNIPNNFHSYMMGINQQNNRVPYTGLVSGPHPQQQRSQRPLVTAANANSTLNSSTSSIKTSKSLPSTGYKINKLIVGNTYDVCVSFVEKGPYFFSVQLISMQDQLTEMMTQLERTHLQLISEDLTVGMPCIARYSEDGQLYRAVISTIRPNGAVVFYIDYGNSEFVDRRDLYELPAQFMRENVFAFPFALAGLKALGAIDDSVKKAFKELVVYKNCKLKVTPPEGPPLVQFCELHIKNRNMIEALQDIVKSRLVYPKAAPLESNEIVEIRYIESPRNFYVQNVTLIEDFGKLMDDMFLYYNVNQNVPQNVTIGAAYAVKNEEEWYRAEVIRADETAIIVRLVDFGYERNVTKNLLSNIAEKHLKMPRQAVHCCLKGFENNELNNKDIPTTQFEMLAEDSTRSRRSFNVKVFRIQPDDLHIVNLFTKDLNVMKKLYKLSMPFETYLTLEKEDFHMNGHANGGSATSTSGQSKRRPKDDNNTKTYSTSSSNIGDEQSSQKSKRSLKENEIKIASIPQAIKQQSPAMNKMPIVGNAYNKPLLHHQQQQLLPSPTPAQRLQQYSSKNSNKSNDWEKNSSASSNRDVKSNASDRSKQTQKSQASSQQQQQQHGRKHQQQQQQQQQDLLNTSFESSTDRRSDVSSNSNRSRGPNAVRQKERRNGKDVSSTKSPRLQKQHQQQERSQNAPQGYSHSRRGSTESLFSVENFPINEKITINNKPEEFMPLDGNFPTQKISTPVTEDVTISWWISPHQFYTHLKSRVQSFNDFMCELQKFYKKRPLKHLSLKQGSHVIARQRRDNMYYRAKVLACNHMLRKYKVLFVDFGYYYTVTSDDIWQVERRFADFPLMAYYCSFKSIVCNYDHLQIIDLMEKYLPNGVQLTCEYKDHIKDMYYVDVKVKNMSLIERLKTDGIITEINPEINLDLLAGQQIRAKIISIKNMLNFKIQIEGCEEAPLISSYDDVRFVKSNPDILPKFKEFYEGKTLVLNVKDVNDNKVLLVRPLLPLFKEDIPTFICSSPRILSSFTGNVVYVALAHRCYIQSEAVESKVAKLLDEMFSHYEKGGQRLPTYSQDQLCAAKSTLDSNWYRARILNVKRNDILVFYLDYGNTETLPKTQLKVLEEKFYLNQNSLSIEVNLPIQVVSERGLKKTKIEELNEKVLKEVQEMIENQKVTVRALSCRRNHLIGEIITESGENVVDTLLAKKLIKSRDIEYMAKYLDKDKTGSLDFIETVDLTLEDEDEAQGDKKQQQGKIQKANAPAKKKGKENENSTGDRIEKKEEVLVKEKQVEKSVEKPKENLVEKPKEEPLKEEKKVDQAPTTSPPSPPALPKIIENSSPPPIESEPVKVEEVPSEIESPISTSSLENYSDMEQAVLSHCDTPAQFFVHPHDKIEQLHKLQENLQIVATSLPPLMNAYNGAYCISLYSVDKQWYRAQIIDAELMVLKFIDFGNTDCLSDATDIKEMSVFPDIEPLCLPCALPIRPNGTADWVDAANAIFNESYTKVLYFTYITQGDLVKPSYINLYIDGVNVAKKLIDDGYAKPLELVDSGENCYISHVNNINDFYIQYEKDSKALELIEIYLSNTETLPKIKEFEKNKIVAALFQDDEMWYRAKLLKSLDGNKYEVLFIDYGNTSITQECREISEEIGNLPPLSKKCSLYISDEEYLGWSDEAEEKFAEIAACGETIFNVELKAPAKDYAVVHLFIDSLNINSHLEPLCMKRKIEGGGETKSVDLNASFGAQSVATIDPNDSSQLHNVVVSHSNGPESFYVQFEKDSARLEDLTSTLNACVGMDLEKGEPTIGKLYAAIFEEDNQLYRARLESIEGEGEGVLYKVRFIDYGNDAVAKELRILPHDLEHVKEIAKLCALNELDKLLEFEEPEKVSEIFYKVIEESSGVVKLNFEESSSEKDSPYIVNLYTIKGNENIFEEVMKRLLSKESESSNSNNISTISNPSTPPTKLEPSQCLIPHTVGPKEFYVQLQKDLTKLEAITKALHKSEVEVLPALSEGLEVGSLYAVYAEEDNLYYRAKITAKEDNKAGDNSSSNYEVYLLDYGNILVSNIFRELPTELREIPPIARPCCLSDLPEGCNANQDLVFEYFNSLIDSHFGEFFEIEFVEEQRDEQKKVFPVKLKVNGKDLNKEISEAIKNGIVPQTDVKPILHDCAIVQINSTASFYIQLLEQTSEIEKITDTLLDAENQFPILEDIKVGRLCAALFPDDGVFYRARIVEVMPLEEGNSESTQKCLVHFIDFGNDAITDQLRKLPENLLNQPRFSKHCELEMKFKDQIAATTQFQAFIDEHYSETFQIEFVKENGGGNSSNDELDTTDEPALCRLFNNEKNVASEIQILLKQN